MATTAKSDWLGRALPMVACVERMAPPVPATVPYHGVINCWCCCCCLISWRRVARLDSSPPSGAGAAHRGPQYPPEQTLHIGHVPARATPNDVVAALVAAGLPPPEDSRILRNDNAGAPPYGFLNYSNATTAAAVLEATRTRPLIVLGQPVVVSPRDLKAPAVAGRGGDAAASAAAASAAAAVAAGDATRAAK